MARALFVAPFGCRVWSQRLIVFSYENKAGDCWRCCSWYLPLGVQKACRWSFSHCVLNITFSNKTAAKPGSSIYNSIGVLLDDREEKRVINTAQLCGFQHTLCSMSLLLARGQATTHLIDFVLMFCSYPAHTLHMCDIRCHTHRTNTFLMVRRQLLSSWVLLKGNRGQSLQSKLALNLLSLHLLFGNLCCISGPKHKVVIDHIVAVSMGMRRTNFQLELKVDYSISWSSENELPNVFIVCQWLKSIFEAKVAKNHLFGFWAGGQTKHDMLRCQHRRSCCKRPNI